MKLVERIAHVRGLLMTIRLIAENYSGAAGQKTSHDLAGVAIDYLRPENIDLYTEMQPPAPDVYYLVHDWEGYTKNGFLGYARTPERAEQWKREGHKVTPVYTQHRAVTFGHVVEAKEAYPKLPSPPEHFWETMPQEIKALVEAAPTGTLVQLNVAAFHDWLNLAYEIGKRKVDSGAYIHVDKLADFANQSPDWLTKHQGEDSTLGAACSILMSYRRKVWDEACTYVAKEVTVFATKFDDTKRNGGG